MTRSGHIPKREARHRRGVTLIEGVLSLTIISVVTVGAITAIGDTVGQQRGQEEHARAVALASCIMSEVMCKPYEDTVAPTDGPEIGELRLVYDDVDDFDGLVESPPRVGLDLLSTTWDGWTSSVQVAWAVPGTPADDAGSDSGLKRITVTVTAPSGREWSLVGLRSRAGVYDKAAEESGLYTAWIGVSIELGGDPGTAMQQGAALTNTVP